MTNSSKIKVYQEVLEQIRFYIEKHQLSEGDKLPSERELSEQLNAARSSVREALRAIELLGLIETKHGEGTFLKTYRPYQTVELLATFVLRESTTKNELLEVMEMLEHQCLIKVQEVITDNEIDILEQEILMHEEEHLHTYVFNYFFEKVKNQLLLKVWHLINNFVQASHELTPDQNYYLHLLKLIKDKNSVEISGLLKDFYQQNYVNAR
ncbi:FadR family transcriptional regulator [Filobacillus milosensis]|uniref:FadR family transcriptional regulator n=1 Tax=Filobacillus milosensis TaxID=94137 RepID=A0A4Y8IZE3_9BACI|nr:GntR family transcriptional regulator [Filobacillus milosensis]TFB25031.1 FadR family transcriptional regulator [Filobacillus milosensis]